MTRALLLLLPVALAASPTFGQNKIDRSSKAVALHLDCAIWAAAEVSDATTEARRSQVSIALGFFVGRYEGMTGKNIDDALVARQKQLKEKDLERLSASCTNSYTSFGRRLIDMSARVQASQ